MTRIHLRHIETAGYCARGARQKAILLGLDWRQFVSEGLPVEELRGIDDEQIKRMIEVAEREARHVQK